MMLPDPKIHGEGGFQGELKRAVVNLPEQANEAN